MEACCEVLNERHLSERTVDVAVHTLCIVTNEELTITCRHEGSTVDLNLSLDSLNI